MNIQKILNCFRLFIRQQSILSIYRNIKSQSLQPKMDIEAYQLEKLNRICNHAYQHIPYYKVLFEESGLVKNKIVTIENLDQMTKLPFLTKEIIRTQASNLYSDDYKERDTKENTSGGSTGKPVLFLQDKEYLIHAMANYYLARSWRGAEPCDNTIHIWGAEQDIYYGKKTFKSRIQEYVGNTIVLNSFKMSDEIMKEYLEVLNKNRPKLIIAYIQSIYELALFAKEHQIAMKKQKAIHAAAGTVYNYMRELIEDVFQCKVYNHYGSREVGSIASECSAHSGLHIMMDNVFVEIVNDKGEICKEGEEGEVVVTTLNNYSMPLIRYKIGDIAIKKKYSECSCLCRYPKLLEVKGRTTDIFITHNREKIDGEYFTHLFYFYDWIEQFQIIQEDINKIVINLVIKESKNSIQEDLQKVKEKIYLVMGRECSIEVNFMKEIPKTKTGKFLYTISKVQQ